MIGKLDPQKVEALKAAARKQGLTGVEFIDDVVDGRRIVGLGGRSRGKPCEITVDVTDATPEMIDRHLGLMREAVARFRPEAT